MSGFARDALAAVESWIDPPYWGNLALLDDGESLCAGGRSWDVLVTPGHAPDHLSLFDRDAGVLVSGDHLLPKIITNPWIEPDRYRESGRRQSLVEYLATLEQFAALDPEVVLPGHGSPFCGVPRLVEILRLHRYERASHVLDHVKVLGRPSAYEVSRSMYPHVDGFALMLGLSEAVGHLELLVAEGCLVAEHAAPVRYEVA